MTTASWLDWELCISPEDNARAGVCDTLESEEMPEKPFDAAARAMIEGLEAAARDAEEFRRRVMRETIVDGRNENPPGHRILDGSDLEIAYNRSGDNLVLRINKGPVQVFRVMLADAFKRFDDRKLFDFNGVSPDFVFKIGDVREGLMAMGRAVGLSPEQMQKLEAKAREIAK